MFGVSAYDRDEKKQTMCIVSKKEIIEEHYQSVCIADMTKQYECSASKICTMLTPEVIKSMASTKVKIVSKQWVSIIENKKMLMAWWTEKPLAGDTVKKVIISDKAQAIYVDLLQQIPCICTDEASGELFKAIRCWVREFYKEDWHLLPC